MVSKNAKLLYFGGPWTDYQCHSETTSNQPHYQFEVHLLGLGPCGFPSFLDFDVQYEVFFRVLIIMTTVKHPYKARMWLAFAGIGKMRRPFTVQILKISISG